MLDTRSPLFPKFLYLKPGVTHVCLASWRGAAGTEWERPLNNSCSLVMPPSPGRSANALSALPALNSSIQSKLAIGARHLKKKSRNSEILMERRAAPHTIDIYMWNNSKIHYKKLNRKLMTCVAARAVYYYYVVDFWRVSENFRCLIRVISIRRTWSKRVWNNEEIIQIVAQNINLSIWINNL